MYKENNNEKILREFTTYLCSRLSLEEALTNLCKFLSTIIPSDRMLCLATDRNAQTLNVLVDYHKENEPSVPQFLQLKHILSWDNLDKDDAYQMTFDMHNNDSLERVAIGYIRDNSQNKESEVFFKQLGIKINSIIGGILLEDRKKNILFTFLITHSEKDIYNANHAKFLSVLLSSIVNLIKEFYRTTSTPYLNILQADSGISSQEKLLRSCPNLSSLMREIDAISPTESLILIQGESGTGKELVADTIHSLSTRKNASLIKVNCGAIPESLLASELFGYERGAFTGANTTKRGYFEQAMNGTIFLDEIGELSMLAQVHLLRVLETDTIRRVGGDKDIACNVRVIAATHRNLKQMVQDGKFREDLWHRVNVYPLHLLPLRKRKDDIPILTQHFYHLCVKKLKIANPPQITDLNFDELKNRSWTGNVRQLRFTIEKALIFSLVDKKPFLHFKEEDSFLDFDTAMQNKTLDVCTRIQSALDICHGKIQGTHGAAALLDIKPSTLRYQMRKCGISLPRMQDKVILNK